MTNSFDYPPLEICVDHSAPEREQRQEFRRTATRADLLDAVAGKCPSLSRAETRVVFEMALEEMATSLTQGEPVKLRSFGLFNVRAKRERIGRNPRTGAEVPITPRRVLTFKPSPVLLEEVNRRAKPRSRAHRSACAPCTH